MLTEKSSGAIVFRREGKAIGYLLLHYPTGHWDFPKGNVEREETEKHAAVREIAEETELKDIVLLEGFKEKVDYFYRRDEETIRKSVVLFLAETRSSAVKVSSEHQGFAWLPFKEAVQRVTFGNAKSVLQKADAFLNSGLTRFA